MAGERMEGLSIQSPSSANSNKKGLLVNRKVAVLLTATLATAAVATAVLTITLTPKSHQDPRYNALPSTPPEKTVEATQPEVVPASLPDFVPAAPDEEVSAVKSAPKDEAVDISLTKSAPQDEVVDIRLPTSLRPIHYEVWLQPFIHGNLSILGSVKVEVEVMEATDNITLHILDIITKNETITVAPTDGGAAVGITKHSYDHERQFYIASLESPLEESNTYHLYMEFEGYLNDALRGFYRSSYQDSEGNDRLIAVTQFEATDARRAFPCFDEPAMKATFQINMAREESMSSVSNMPLNETVPVDGQDGWVWDRFQVSLPMSTYLVAFVVSDFKAKESNANDHVLFRVWAREEALSQADYALTAGPSILTFYEGYFNVSFPLPKQDMIAIPDFAAGAMENWGLITYRETALLYDEAVSSARNKEYVGVVVGHELAHQWFGNLVTMKWWNDIWLNEGFATYVQLLGTDSFEPSWQVKDKFVPEDLHRVLESDSLESSHPISVPVYDPTEISQIFDDISYSKGASVLRMMNYFLTEGTFRKGLTNYLNTLAYGNAEQDDLWHYLTVAGQEDGTLPVDMTVKMIMDTWTLQMGYPVITVNRSQDGTTAIVTQERFLSVKNETSPESDEYRWWVPLTYTSQDDPDFNATQPTMWMKDTEVEVTVSSLPASDKWVIFNLQETGYYRVNYDTNNWNLLVQQLTQDHTVIHVVNRAQIIDDALDLARAGDLPYVTALDTIAYLGDETEFFPWESAMNNLEYIKSMFTRKGGYGALEKYLLSLLVPLYDSVGFEDNANDPQLEHYKRTLASSWVCGLDYQDCVEKSVTLYQDWMLSPDDGSISPNQKSTVYCTGIAEGGEEEWNFAWNQYLTSNLGQEKDTLLSALACTKELWILSRYLEMAFTEDSGIRRQDASSVFAAISRNDIGRDLAWNFLRDQWLMISNYFGSFTTLGDLVRIVAEDFNTREEKHQLEVFKEDHLEELGTATRAVDQAIERTSNNIAWMDQYYQVILQWLHDHGYGLKRK